MSVVREDVVRLGVDVDGLTELKSLMDALDEVKRVLRGGIGDDAFDEMVSESKKAADGLEDLKASADKIKPDGIDKTTDAVKDTKEETSKATQKLKEMGRTSFDKTLGGLKKLVATLGKVALKAGAAVLKLTAAAAAGVGAVVAKSVMSYADYEQLVGGVETLFKGSAGIVQKNANAAFGTAGLSANDYMETVTSFSASLINSLGGDTEKAAAYADVAIIDMSDNANKMGSDMGSIQDAYQGFAKQNYTIKLMSAA